MRSKGSWGVGDLTDLTDLAVWAGSRHGAGYVLVNPLHAAAPTRPMEPSPYLPTSRRFVNPLYLRVEAIPEYADLRKRGRVRRLRDEVRGACPQARLDRPGQRVGGQTTRRCGWSTRCRGRRDASSAYAAFREREGRALDDFATWCALAEAARRRLAPVAADAAASQIGRRSPSSPKSTVPQSISTAGCSGSSTSSSTAAQSAARAAPGWRWASCTTSRSACTPNGADAWALQDVLALGVTAGAPPDEYNQLGQDWSQPPWRPDQLAEHEYLPFRALIATVLRHAGGVRIDHIIGLFRLWWIPRGRRADRGHLRPLRP